MSGRRTLKGHTKEGNMPKAQDKSNTGARASNTDTEHASGDAGAAQASPGTSINSADIVGAINELKTDLKGDNDRLRREINSLGQEINGKLDNLTEEMQSLSDRVEEAETRVGRVEDWAAEVTEMFSTCVDQQKALQHKLTDLESRSRRNNICIFEVAEDEEGNSVPQFITNLLKRELPLPQDLDLKIQRVHRSLAQKPRPENPPRPIIINFQEFTTKELVLREAWKKGKMQLGNRSLYFDHDYAAEIVKERREYNIIKKILKEKGICFQTPYTSMWIHWDSGTRTYSDAREAQRELQRRGFTVEIPEPEEEESTVESRLNELLGRQRMTARRERGSSAAQRAKEKLQEFQRAPDK